MNLRGGDYSEPRLHHCTPACETERDFISKKKRMLYLAEKTTNIYVYSSYVIYFTRTQKLTLLSGAREGLEDWHGCGEA